jgi:pyrimidine-specific ribonucleoside hydrolase
MKVIFDCDPGLDDGVALIAAFGSDDLDIKAITTVFGCSTVENTTTNALKFLDFIGREDVKVAKGASMSMEGKTDIAPFVHGETGFKNIFLPETKNKPYEKNAIETIYEVVMESDEKTFIITTGPLTNVGQAISRYPDLVERIGGISIMGGAIGMGNKNPVAEANIWNDPIAAKIVFDSGIPITMSGLNVTFKAKVYEKEIEEIKKIGTPIAKLAAGFLQAHFEFYKAQGFDGDPVHDLCAVASLVKKDIFTMVHCHVDVETKGEFTKGETVVDLQNKYGKVKNSFICTDVDRDAFVEFLKDRIVKLSKSVYVEKEKIDGK